MQNFYNTIHQSGTDLLTSQKKAKSQDEIILAYFEKYPTHEFSPPQIQEALSLYTTPITSVRRSITTLTNDGKLIKTKNQVKGIYNKPNYTGKLLVKEGQRTLF